MIRALAAALPSQRRIAKIPAMPDKRSPPRMLVNKLSVEDARHLLKGEGGDLTATELVLQLVAIGVVSFFTARAIIVGDATVWHLALPMVAQYLALIVALPFIQLIVRHPAITKDAIGALRLWIGIAVVVGVTVAVRAHDAQTAWQEQLRGDATRLWRWIADAEMHWPVALALLGMLVSLPGRVRNLFEHGPPFVAVSLGCGMRIGVLFLGAAALPWALSNSRNAVWFLWALVLVSEALALWMHWDIQRRLEKFDAQSGPQSRARSS
jgi:hypothetical protein